MKQIVRDVMVRVNGIDISAICRSITLESSKTEEEVTGYGTQYRENIAGIDETQIELELLLGTDGAVVVTEPTLDPPVVPGGSAYWNGLLFRSLLGETAVLDIAPHNGGPATTNPWTTVTASLLTRRLLSGNVGEAMMGALSFKASGAVSLDLSGGLFPALDLFPSVDLFPEDAASVTVGAYDFGFYDSSVYG